MNSAHIAPFTALSTHRLRRVRAARRALLPLFVGSCALPLASAHAQTSPIQPVSTKAKATAAQTPPILLVPVALAQPTLSLPTHNAVASKIAAPVRVVNDNGAPEAVASAVAPDALTSREIRVNASANIPPVQLPPAQLPPVATAPVRLAQLQPRDSEAPATPPETGRDGLSIPVGPEIPSKGTPAAPPPDTSTPPPRLVPPTGAGVLDTTPDQVPIIGDVRAAEGREISEVRVVGSRVVPADTILAQVRLQRGAAFSSRQAQLDLGRINQLGFFAATQAQVAPDLSDPNKTVVTYIVVENRVITGFEFVNNTAIKADDILPLLTSKTGTVLNRNSVSADVTAIQKLYQDKGFAVIVKSAQQTEEGKLVFDLSEATISQINIVGLKKTQESLVRRQIRIKPGDTFSAAKMRQDLNRLYDTNFFDAVDPRVDDDPNQAGAVIVNFVFREKRTGQFQVGVGFDTRSKLSGFLTLSESNLRGTGQRGFASIEAGSQRNFELGTGNPFIGDKNASYDVSVYRRSIFREPRSLVRLIESANANDTTGTTINADAFSSATLQEQRTGGRFNFTRPLDYDRRRTLIFGYRNERASARATDVNGNTATDANGDPIDISSILSQGTVSAASLGFLRDTRDLRIDPSSGGRESLVVEQAFKFLGGNTSFTKLDVDLRRYFPIIAGEKIGAPAKLVLAGRVVLGRSVNQLPIFEQYYIGGTETVRGYNTEQQYGDNQLYGNAELRYRFQQKVTGVLFADSGTAYGGRFSTGNDIDLLTSIGVGVRLVTPIGPIRLDYGVGKEGGRTHFGIGSTF